MKLSKRERLQRLLAGEKADRAGVALWRHWPGDDQDAVELARSTLDWQRQFDFDFVKVTPDSNFAVEGWGAQSVWEGSNEGGRRYIAHPLATLDAWYALAPQDPGGGRLGEQARCLELIGRELPPDTPFIQTIFSPTAQFKYLVGPDHLAAIRRHPEAAEHVLRVITETILGFLEGIRHTGVAGIFYALQLATAHELTVDEYQRFGRPYDLQILEAANELFWLNLLHMHGQDAHFDLLASYPVRAINWHDRESGPSLAAARQRFSGALVGGLRQWETMLRGTPDQVRAEAADAIAQTDGRGFILGTGCVTPVASPLGNIRAS